MKRFKTKQECKKAGMFTGIWDAHMSRFTINSLWGLPTDVFDEFIDSRFITTNPHPFDSMGIKIKVTPKQVKKLIAKGKVMGYSCDSNLQNKLYNDGGIEIRNKHMLLLCSLTNWYFNFFDKENGIELTYKQFMNGTVPKKKKKFKVGDWVSILVHKYHTGAYEMGHICQISKITENDNFQLHDEHGTHPEGLIFLHNEIKHAAKPVEKPLIFKGHEIIKQKDSYTIGCATISCSDIDAFIRVCDKAQEEATPNEIAELIEKHYK